MSYLRSVERFAKGLGTETYSVSKTSFMFIVLIGKEGANSRSDPTEYRDGEGNLNFVARMSELNIIIGLEGFVGLNLFMLPKKILRFFHFHNKRFLNQCVPNPLVMSISLKLSQCPNRPHAQTSPDAPLPDIDRILLPLPLNQFSRSKTGESDRGVRGPGYSRRICRPAVPSLEGDGGKAGEIRRGQGEGRLRRRGF